MTKRSPKPTRKPTHDALKARFDAAHQAGMASLKARDFEGVDRAIKAERAVIEQQNNRVKAFTARLNKSRSRSKT